MIIKEKILLRFVKKYETLLDDLGHMTSRSLTDCLERMQILASLDFMFLSEKRRHSFTL